VIAHSHAVLSYDWTNAIWYLEGHWITYAPNSRCTVSRISNSASLRFDIWTSGTYIIYDWRPQRLKTLQKLLYKTGVRTHVNGVMRKVRHIKQQKCKEKALRETQTLPDGCSKAEPKHFCHTASQTPFPGVRDGQNLISWRWSLYLYLQTQFGEDRCTQFRVIVVTVSHTHKYPHPQTVA